MSVHSDKLIRRYIITIIRRQILKESAVKSSIPRA